MTEQEWGRLRCAFQTHDAALCEIHRLRAVLDTHSQITHPWYGPCDGLAPGGKCAECLSVLSRVAI